MAPRALLTGLALLAALATVGVVSAHAQASRTPFSPAFRSGDSPLGPKGPADLGASLPLVAGAGEPELRVVARAVQEAPTPARTPALNVAGQGGRSGSMGGLGESASGMARWSPGRASRPVVAGLEAVAVYSYLRAREQLDAGGRAAGKGSGADAQPGALGSPTGAALALETAADGGQVCGRDGAADAVLLAHGVRATGLARDPRPGAAGPASTLGGGADFSAAELPSPTTAASALALAGRIADRVAGVVEAVRALQLTSYSFSADTRLRLDVKTGHHKRLFLIVNHRF